MSLRKIYYGTIIHFNEDKGFGFIRPDVPREDGKSYFFHRNNGSQVSEKDGPGELELAPGTPLNGTPRNGMRVAFYRHDGKKANPTAYLWTWEPYWRICEVIVSKRPAPDEPECRIVKLNYRHKRPIEVVAWSGSYRSLVEHLDKETPQLDYSTIWIEQKLVTGWERMWHPEDWHPKYKKEKVPA